MKRLCGTFPLFLLTMRGVTYQELEDLSIIGLSCLIITVGDLSLQSSMNARYLPKLLTF